MKKLYLIGIILAIFLSACSKDTVDNSQDAALYALFDELLIDEIAEDDIGINFSFINPENFGISPALYDNGFTSRDEWAALFVEGKESLARLKTFEPAKLSSKAQWDLEILIYQTENYLKLEDYYDYVIGNSFLGYSRSLSVNLPAYLEAYEFRNNFDIEAYLNYIDTLPESASEYVTLEIDRQSRNTGFGQEELDEIIRLAQDSAAAIMADDYYLIANFNERIDRLDFLSTEEKTLYKTRNLDLLHSDFASTYALIAAGLSGIEANASTGLANKAQGKEYYELALQNAMGYRKSAQEVIKYLDDELYATLQSYVRMNDRYTDMMNFDYGNFGSDRELLDFLEVEIRQDFPAIADVNYDIFTVDPSMKEGSSPAFYFTPPLDNDESHVQKIFVNGSFSPDNYQTYAHEGFPGHMYQFNYFHTLDLHPLRLYLSESGNAEGWAHYIESIVLNYVSDDEELIEFMNLNQRILDIIIARCDLGIHYQGWSFDEFYDYISSYLNVSQEGIRETYLYIIHTPTAYPLYYVSALFILDIKEAYQEKKGNSSKDIDFHRAFMELGGAPLSIIEKYLTK